MPFKILLNFYLFSMWSSGYAQQTSQMHPIWIWISWNCWKRQNLQHLPKIGHPSGYGPV